MINITFPNGDVRSYNEGVTAYEIAQGISPRLAAEVLAAKVNDVVVDLSRPITPFATVQLLKWEY